MSRLFTDRYDPLFDTLGCPVYRFGTPGLGLETFKAFLLILVPPCVERAAWNAGLRTDVIHAPSFFPSPYHPKPELSKITLHNLPQEKRETQQQECPTCGEELQPPIRTTTLIWYPNYINN
jgi:hypothetical protein